MIPLFLLTVMVVLACFKVYQLAFVVGGLAVLYWEVVLNLDAAKFFPILQDEESMNPGKRHKNKNGILQSKASMLVVVTKNQRNMWNPVTGVYVLVLCFTFYQFPLSWQAFAFLVPTFGHFFLLWVASNHKKKVEIHIEKLPSEDQSEIFRLARLEEQRLKR